MNLKFLSAVAVRQHIKGKRMRSSSQFEARLNYEVEKMINKAIERAFSQRTRKMRRVTLWAMDL